MAEKRRLVELTMAPLASVAEVARAYNLNANQLFTWRRAFERGELSEPSTALVPVTVSEPNEAEPVTTVSSSGSIHIELPCRAVISVEHGADARLLQKILESLRK
jgi:transposase